MCCYLLWREGVSAASASAVLCILPLGWDQLVECRTPSVGILFHSISPPFPFFPPFSFFSLSFFYTFFFYSLFFCLREVPT